jgi:membrane protease YdiL (CAAX protease family)
MARVCAAEVAVALGALRASVVVGLMWAVWHLGPWELLFVGDLRTALRENGEHVLRYALTCVPLSVLFSWVYINTRRSLLIVILFHASYNLTITATRCFEDFPDYTLVAVMWVVAATIALFSGPTLVARPLGLRSQLVVGAG